MKAMKPGGLALFFSNDIYPTSADGTLPFKQHADIFYLTGVDQEETVLLLFHDAHNPADREILFSTETNEELAIWEGAKLTKAQAHSETGIRNAQWTSAFERTLHRLMAEAQSLYLNDNQQTRARLTVETRTDRENASIRAKYPNHEIERSAPILHSIRALKQPSEIDQMQRACDITKAGFDRVLQFVKPGVMEYEIEAEFMHEFLRRGSRGFAYTPIIGSGSNACVLHYIENSAECKAGDVILMDVGAEYGNFASDMTRCVPVSGQFTDRQRAVYNAVLSVMRDATQLLRPGVSLHEYHKEVGDLMTAQLLDSSSLTATTWKNRIRRGQPTRSISCMGPPISLASTFTTWVIGMSPSRRDMFSRWNLESTSGKRTSESVSRTMWSSPRTAITTSCGTSLSRPMPLSLR